MEVKIYDQEKVKYHNSEIVEGLFRRFNQKEDKISDFKLIFILQNGEYLFMPYLDIDNHDGMNEEYAHIVYILKALELIIKKLEYNREKFIEEKIKDFSVEDLISVILNLNIAFFYNTSFYDIEDNYKNMSVYFGKPLNLSERQKKSIATLRHSVEEEQYEIGIMKLEKDKNLRDYEQLNLVDSGNIQYIFGKDIDIDINTLFHILDIDDEIQK